MKNLVRWRPGFWGGLLYLLLVLGGGVLAVRFTRGLGAVTNLSDRFPWGLWVGFDVLCGVGLAAGGFATWAWQVAKRLYGDDDSGPALPL